ncbi:MAG: hypothetical protein KDC34_09390 [Saprospiraceae bacterium]|nr:hypothetical protein [Saprospiraceae bacterium]
MKVFQKVLFTLCLFVPFLLSAQDGGPVYADETFRGTRVINGHSIECLNEGELDFLISHRFGRVNGGLYEFFGLDQASIRLGFEYGIKRWLNVGIGRSSYGKHVDSFVKIAFLRQSDRAYAPISITGFSSIAVNTLKPADPTLPVPFQTRLAYTNQLLFARKFGDRLSMQLAPTLVHYNLVDFNDQSNDKFFLGGAIRFRMTKNIAILVEYYQPLIGQLAPGKFPPLAIGFDINTGGHVFQLHFTNASSMIEKGFLGETTGDWMNGDIQFGFNVARTFKLKGRRY